MTYRLDQIREGSGFFERGLAGENLAVRKLVYLDVSGEWRLADSSAASTMPCIGLTLDPIPNGQQGNILREGFVGDPSWTWTRGGKVYVSETAGELTQTVPSGAVLQPVAIAYENDLIYFVPSLGGGGSGGCAVLEGATAYVGFDACKEPYVNYFLCDGTADNVQINAAGAYVVSLGGGTIVFEEGTYDIIDPIIPTGGDLWYKGQGESTFLDGDGLATTEHIFHITGRDRITISDMSMQTQNGGAKTCHCIFIEDGSDDFHINRITFVDSDDNCIHVEGTTINLGYIDSCHINGADGHGIYVNMDNGNTINRLNIINCDMVAVGNAGIYFDASAGNNYCVIESNIIVSSAGVGIYVDDFINGQIIRNECILGGLSGIHVVGSSEVTITDNQCLLNERHGIFLTATTTDCVVAGNICNDNDDHDTATYDGINIDNACSGNTVNHNVCLRNHRHGIYSAGIGNQISVNTVGENDVDGIRVSGGDCTINGNTVYDNSQDAAGTNHGIQLMGSADRSIVENNHINGYGDSQEDGIHLGNGTTECLIQGNHCQDGMGSGIALSANDDDNSIIGNYLFENDDYGIEISAESCNDNLVKNNYFSGNVTGAFLDTGTDTRVHELFSMVIDPDTTLGTHPAVDLPDSADTPVRFQILVPLEFQETVTAHVIVAQTATVGSPNMQWSTDVDFGKIGADEAYNIHTDAETDQVTAITQNDLELVDVSGSLTGLYGGDLVGFEFIRRATQAGDTINDAAYFLGFRLRYV